MNKKWKFVSLKDRFYIEKCVQKGEVNATDLSLQLGVAYSTIYYELRRCPKGKYTAEAAEKDKLYRKFNKFVNSRCENAYPKKKMAAVKKLMKSIDFNDLRTFYETYTETKLFPQEVNENLKKLLIVYSANAKVWTLAKASEMTGLEEEYIKRAYYFAIREEKDLWKESVED